MPQAKPAANQAANQQGKPKSNPGGFKAGHDPRRNAGNRERPNALTRDIKRGIVDAAIAHGINGKGKGGLTGYLTFLAGKHPKAFAGLLGKTIPLQINGAVGAYIGTVNIVSVPTEKFLSAEDIAQLQAPAIDATPEAAAWQDALGAAQDPD